MQTLLLYLRLLIKSPDVAAFLEHCPHPVIVFEPFSEIAETGFHTMAGNRAPAGSPMVGVVAKRPGANVFMHMVTVGRAANNDIELKARSVSKCHLLLTSDAQGNHFVMDASSTFGTLLNGVPLEAQVRTPIHSKDRLELGDVVGVFYEPAALYEFLKAELDRSA